jgi:hypothetical protein
MSSAGAWIGPEPSSHNVVSSRSAPERERDPGGPSARIRKNSSTSMAPRAGRVCTTTGQSHHPSDAKMLADADCEVGDARLNRALETLGGCIK